MMSDDLLQQDPLYIRKSTTPFSLNDKSNELLDINSNDEPSNQTEIKEENSAKKEWCKKALLHVIRILKLVSLGKFKTKFYYKKNSTYSSAFGGILSLIFYIYLFNLIIIAVTGLIYDSNKSLI